MTKLTTLAILIATSTAVHAENLEEKQYWKKQQNYLDEYLKRSEKACGIKITQEWVDKPKFREEATKTKHSPFSICGNMVDRVSSLCREGEDEKAAVVAKIKHIKCGFAPERKLDIKGGTLTYFGNHVQANFDDWAKPALTKKL